MSWTPDESDGGESARAASGLGKDSLARLLALFEACEGLARVWVFGSRARGDYRDASDLDLVADLPDADPTSFARLKSALEDLELVQRIDLVRWQDALDAGFRERILRDRKLFWTRARGHAEVDTLGAIQLKPFQTEVLQRFDEYLTELVAQRGKAERARKALGVLEDADPTLLRETGDFPKRAWETLRQRGSLPALSAERAHSSRFDGAERPYPNLCFKVPTGGGKTLLAAASVARVFSSYLQRHTGLVLWVVPNDAIYRQTLRALSDRDHPYRQILNLAGAGRVKVLEKTSPLSRLDVESHLCVMVLMLASAARQSKETLRFFRDRGNVLGFLPREDDIEAHWNLLETVPNLDVYAPFGASGDLASRQKGSIVKSSLGNVMRLLQPMVVMDEGQHAYTENAMRTLDGFNPCLLLELSATPRVANAKASGSNVLVDVRGNDLDAAEMIKLPIQVDVKRWEDWRACLAAAVERLRDLQAQAERLREDSARYIRPILLVQVERTGADQRETGYIHAEDARDYLRQLGFGEAQIAIKTSEKDELEDIDLLAPTCEIRAIVTKQALQEGWDCPFAYVLCALAAGRSPAAMTQLVGRILRLPHTAKTGITDLDACYVLCHDADTGKVVQGIKRALETEGMGDLALSVRSERDDAGLPEPVRLTRRKAFADLRLFLPRVTWVEADGRRRLLDYDSDILAHLDWAALDPEALAVGWRPGGAAGGAAHLSIGLEVLDRHGLPRSVEALTESAALDRARIVRALLDLAPNAWLCWSLVDSVLTRLLGTPLDASAIATSLPSLIEQLRLDLERERDRLAQDCFERFVASGRIAFSLRADACDFELPQSMRLELGAAPAPLLRDGYAPIEKSLLEPALRLPDMNQLEAQFAAYLDERAALRWWHRNVAKTQYGLQGWKRNKVYPDFVFARVRDASGDQLVLLETKGLHLGGSADTQYKQALLARLGEAFRDERLLHRGELELADEGEIQLRCDLVLESGWRAEMDRRYFAG